MKAKPAEEERIPTPPRQLVLKTFPLSIDQVSDLLLMQKDVEDGLVQYTRSLDRRPIVRVPGGAGAWKHDTLQCAQYRVYVRSEKEMGESISDDLYAAVHEACQAAKIPTPRLIAEFLLTQTSQNNQ